MRERDLCRLLLLRRDPRGQAIHDRDPVRQPRIREKPDSWRDRPTSYSVSRWMSRHDCTAKYVERKAREGDRSESSDG